MKGCFAVLGVMVVVVIVAVGGVFAYFSFVPGNSQALPTIAVSDKSAKDLDQKLSDVEKSIKEAKTSSKPVPISLRITEQELTAKANQALVGDPALTGLNPRDIQIHLTPGKLVANATLSVRGFDAKATINAIINVSNGQPVVTIQSVQLGGIPVPSGLSEQLGDKIQSSIAQLWGSTSLEVQKVEIQQGVMVITGVAKP
jgi:hypothetical protein